MVLALHSMGQIPFDQMELRTPSHLIAQSLESIVELCYKRILDLMQLGKHL